MLRWLRREFRDYPATMTICALWIVAYGALLAVSFAQGTPPSWRGWLWGTPGGERLGDMSLPDLARGQYWRTLTSTFVHYGLVHLAMNLFGMYQLGSLIEEWYGPWQTLSLYVLIGAGGNALSATVRHALGSSPHVHSGGGSTVLLGFVALCAVMGWRERTRMGDFLRGQMVAILIYTALLGIALPVANAFVPVPLIDNWGHAGGALVGAIVGFAHPWLERRKGSRLALLGGAMAVAALVACAGLQWRADHAQAPQRALVRLRRAQTVSDALTRVAFQYELDYAIAQRARKGARGLVVGKDRRRAISFALTQLEATRPELANGPTRDDFRRVRALLEQARNEPPGRGDVEAFGPPFRNLRQRAGRAFATAAAGYAAATGQALRIQTVPTPARSPAARPRGAAAGPAATATH